MSMMSENKFEVELEIDFMSIVLTEDFSFLKLSFLIIQNTIKLKKDS